MNTSKQPLAPTDAYNVVRGFAFVYANGRMYGFDHKVTQQSTADAMAALKRFNVRHGDLHLAIEGNDFQYDGQILGPPLNTISDLARCLNTMQAPSLVFKKGIAESEVTAFLRLLFANPATVSNAGGLTSLIEQAGMSNIRVAHYSYQRITEEQTVVDKTSATDDSMADAVTILEGLFDKAAPEEAQQKAVTKTNLDDKQVVSQLSKMAAPPPDTDLSGPEVVATQAVERLQNMSDRLLEDPANRTLKGRRAIRKIIKDAEIDITDRLQRLGADIQAVEMLAARVKEMVEELAIGGLVAQYMKLQVDLAQKERRLKRHISGAKRRGVDPETTKVRLSSLGLSQEAIENLSTAAIGGKGKGKGKGKGTGGDDSTSATPAATAENTLQSQSQLSVLLKKLQKTVPGDGTLPTLVEEILDEMNKTLEKAATRASEQIESLRQITMIPAGRSDNADLSRRQVLELMAELGQEMRQPLTVVMGAVDIVSNKYLGNLPAEQAPMIKMATESATVLADLIDRMVKIAGMPFSLQPDEEIMKRLKKITP